MNHTCNKSLSISSHFSLQGLIIQGYGTRTLFWEEFGKSVRSVSSRKQTILCCRSGSSFNGEASGVSVPALSNYGLSLRLRDIHSQNKPPTTANNNVSCKFLLSSSFSRNWQDLIPIATHTSARHHTQNQKSVSNIRKDEPKDMRARKKSWPLPSLTQGSR